MLIGVHVFVAGSKRPPVLSGPEPSRPPQTSMTVPVHTPSARCRALGAFAVLVGVHCLVAGSSIPPLAVTPLGVSPPQMIITVSVATPTCRARPAGASTSEVGSHGSAHAPALHAPKQAWPHDPQSVDEAEVSTHRAGCPPSG